MSIRPRQLAQQDFAALAGKIYEAVTEGHRDYARKYGSEASTHRRNTRRSLIRDHIVKRLRAALDGERGVNIRDSHGTTYFNFFGRWQVIVRMLGRKAFGVVLNRTQLALGIQDNAEDAPLLGPLFRGTTKLYLGYLTPEEPDQLDVLLVAPDGKRNAWDLPIEPPAQGEVVPLRPKTPPPEDDLLVNVRKAPAETVTSEETDSESVSVTPKSQQERNE